MAGISNIPIDDVLLVGAVFDDDADATVSKDVTKSSSKVTQMTVTATNAGYLHVWDNRNPTGGTTAMDFTIKCAAGITEAGFPNGLVFEEGCSFMYTTDAGTAAVTSPGTPSDIWISYTKEGI